MNYKLMSLELTPTANDFVDQIIQQVKATPKKDLLSVVGQLEVSENIVRVENLVFHDNSLLQFTNLDAPYLVVAAKNLKFNAPKIKSSVSIKSIDINRLKGDNGSNGANAQNGNGAHGSNGTTGGKGKTKQLPDVYLMIENISTDFGDLSTFDWRLIFSGFKGGQGGQGGNGGNGGRGQDGVNSASGPGFCRRGGGNGQNGGNGGRGGKGGDGGDGGDGAAIYLVSQKVITDRLTYAQFFLEGGEGGDPGIPGNSGEGGTGGSGGSGSTFCSGGNAGGRGVKPDNLGHGNKGNSGSRGEIVIINKNISDLFK